MKEETAEFLLIKNQNGEGLRLVAFVHFRFCLDEDLPVIYW